MRNSYTINAEKEKALMIYYYQSLSLRVYPLYERIIKYGVYIILHIWNKIMCKVCGCRVCLSIDDKDID